MVVDGVFSTVGTANMDYRSFNINFEVNALLYNKEFGDKLVDMFNTDLKDTTQLDLENWQQRSKRIKFIEAMARLAAPLL